MAAGSYGGVVAEVRRLVFTYLSYLVRHSLSGLPLRDVVVQVVAFMVARYLLERGEFAVAVVALAVALAKVYVVDAFVALVVSVVAAVLALGALNKLAVTSTPFVCLRASAEGWPKGSRGRPSFVTYCLRSLGRLSGHGQKEGPATACARRRGGTWPTRRVRRASGEASAGRRV